MKIRILLFVFLTLGVAGCRHAPSDVGASSFEVIRPPALAVGGPGKAAPAEENAVDFREALAIRPLVMPVYPAAALAARAGRAQVGVRMTVDHTGKVTDVGSSLFVLSTPGPFAGAFRDAVEAAVRQWRFRPAEILHLETVRAPEVTYNRIVRRETIEAQFDLAFTFTATGRVDAGMGK